MKPPLSVRLLSIRGIAHGFGVRGARVPAGLRRPKQVHGAAVVGIAECAEGAAPEADAVVSSESGQPVGVLTADCVPLLLACEGGGTVAAVHAGWRGLAKGVVEAAIDALRHGAGDSNVAILAAIGPHIGPCCYEVDEPVIEALASRFPDEIDASLTPSKTRGRALLNLSHLAIAELEGLGLERSQVALVERSCTHCDALRFHSYRRDGPRSGRLVHYICARSGFPSRPPG